MTSKLIRLERKDNVILVADDDMFSRSTLKAALQDMAAIVETTSGGDVLKLYKQHNPDIVLLDLHMPEKSGQDVMREILAYDKSAYIIIISGDSVALTVQQTYKNGAKAFISKPLSKELLLKYILPCPTMMFQDSDRLREIDRLTAAGTVKGTDSNILEYRSPTAQ